MWVYFVTWWAYAANHITRKCYTNVKNVMKAKGLEVDVIGRMDAGFMFTYAFGAPAAGQLGDRCDARSSEAISGAVGDEAEARTRPLRAPSLDAQRYDSSKVIGIGLYGSALCIFLLAFGIWNGYQLDPMVSNVYFLGVYLIFGFFQARGWGALCVGVRARAAPRRVAPRSALGL